MHRLVKAAAKGRADKIQKLIAKGVDVNVENSAAVFVAATNGHTELVRLLVSAGGRVNERIGTGDGPTPVWGAASSGHADVIELLLGEPTPMSR